MDSTDVRTTWNRASADYAGRRELLAPERWLLHRFRDRWPAMSILDVGVGAGRTTYTFGALAGRYVGVDFAPEMIARSRELVPADDRVRLVVGDVRDLSGVGTGFDLVLFSYNGIDNLDHPDRLTGLREMRQVAAEDGWLFLSTHSVHCLRTFTPMQWAPHGNSPMSLLRRGKVAKTAWRYRRELRHVDLDAAERTGWTLVRDPARGFQLEHCYVTVAEQLAEFAATGWEVVDVLDLEGRPVDPERPPTDAFLHYLCRAAARPARPPRPTAAPAATTSSPTPSTAGWAG